MVATPAAKARLTKSRLDHSEALPFTGRDCAILFEFLEGLLVKPPEFRATKMAFRIVQGSQIWEYATYVSPSTTTAVHT
jgi:hypothetical protein